MISFAAEILLDWTNLSSGSVSNPLRLYWQDKAPGIPQILGMIVPGGFPLKARGNDNIVKKFFIFHLI